MDVADGAALIRAVNRGLQCIGELERFLPPARAVVMICLVLLIDLQRLATFVYLLLVSPHGLHNGEILLLRVAWQEVERTLIIEIYHVVASAVH